MSVVYRALPSSRYLLLGRGNIICYIWKSGDAFKCVPGIQRKRKQMPAYLIGHITIKDPDKWAEYRNRVPGTLEPWDAELVFRGKRTAVLSGEHYHTDTVVIRFPDIDSITKWHYSSAYQELIPLRTQAADMDLISYESEQ